MKVIVMLLVLSTLSALTSLAIHLMWRAHPALDALSDAELLDEAYAQAEFGNFPNEYSRGYDRRMMFGRAV